MKKTYIENEIERNALYVGIPSVYGEWILETSGDPISLNELEDAGCEEEIEKINAIIASPNTAWEDLTDEDAEYIADTLKSWGIG